MGFISNEAQKIFGVNLKIEQRSSQASHLSMHECECARVQVCVSVRVCAERDRGGGPRKNVITTDAALEKAGRAAGRSPKREKHCLKRQKQLI